jgi:hypothetical protein
MLEKYWWEVEILVVEAAENMLLGRFMIMDSGV